MKKKNMILLLAMVSFFTVSCKKSTDETPVEEPAPAPVDNTLCDGKSGKLGYLPLSKGNKWTYKYNYFSSGMNPTPALVGDTSTINGKVYFSCTGTEMETYMREDPTTHAIYVFDNGDSLFLPGSSPILNQYLYHHHRVDGINVSIHTSSCDYTGCIKIGWYSSSGSLIGSYWYKKGLGFVTSSDFTLTAVSIN